MESRNIRPKKMSRPAPRGMPGSPCAKSSRCLLRVGAGQALLSQPLADLIEPRPESLSLHRSEAGRSQGQLELLVCQRQVAVADVVFRHVVIRVARVSSGARGQCGLANLL